MNLSYRAIIRIPQHIPYRLQLILIGLLLAVLSACSPSGTHRGTGEYIDDTAVTARVKTALATDPNVKATEVQVETFRGTVQLSGFVDSPESAARAARLARDTPGVREVRNAMVVREQRRQ